MLPAKLREKLLHNIPQADVLSLLDTPFVDGLEMNAVWEKLSRCKVEEGAVPLDCVKRTFTSDIMTSKFRENWLAVRCPLGYTDQEVLRFIGQAFQSYLQQDDPVIFYPLPQLLPESATKYLLPPKELNVDCTEFILHSWFWKEYMSLLEKVEDRSVEVDVSIPSLRKYLCKIEQLAIGSRCGSLDHNSEGFDESTVYAPYVIVYNIITSKRPTLRSLEFYGYANVIDSMMTTVLPLLCKPLEFTSKNYWRDYDVCFVTPPQAPYVALEKLSVLPDTSSPRVDNLVSEWLSSSIRTTTTCMGSAEPELLVDTYHKLVASSVGELQCNTVRHFRK